VILLQLGHELLKMVHIIRSAHAKPLSTLVVHIEPVSQRNWLSVPVVLAQNHCC